MVSISESNSKMGNIPSFSLLPCVTCREDAPCKNGCYAVRISKLRPLVSKTYFDNTQMAQSNLDSVKNAIEGWIAYRHPQFFRIHVAGDFFSLAYFNMWLTIARRNPDTLFFTFTKQWPIIREWASTHRVLPSNMSIILSAWIPVGDPSVWMPQEDLMRSFPCAWIVRENRMEEDVRAIASAIPFKRMKKIQKCEGHCETCGRCCHLRKVNGDVLFYYH